MRSHRVFVPLLALLATCASGAEPRIQMLRMSEEGGGVRVSAVRVSRPGDPGETSVVVVQGGRSRLFLRRSRPDAATTVYETWLDAKPGVTIKKRGGEPLLFEAGGYTLPVVEADLARRTVRCWIATLAARVEPRLLSGASDVRLLKEWSGRDRLDDAFFPITVLWQVEEPATIAPRGTLKSENGPFDGEAWSDLAAAAMAELGR